MMKKKQEAVCVKEGERKTGLILFSSFRLGENSVIVGTRESTTSLGPYILMFGQIVFRLERSSFLLDYFYLSLCY